MELNDLSKRISQLLNQSQDLLTTRKTTQYFGEKVDSGKLAGLRASVLSFIEMVYGKKHSHYSEFDSATNISDLTNAQKAYEILRAIQEEIDGGWIFSLKKLVSAEIFSDFIEMAEHLLEQGYKDPAAVVIGSVLEENLRQLCFKNNIDVEFEKDGKLIPKKADGLNSDLARAEVYSKLDQKSITMWLSLRNDAAHGKYDMYEKEQVMLMLQGVANLLVRVSI